MAPLAPEGITKVSVYCFICLGGLASSFQLIAGRKGTLITLNYPPPYINPNHVQSCLKVPTINVLSVDAGPIYAPNDLRPAPLLFPSTDDTVDPRRSCSGRCINDQPPLTTMQPFLPPLTSASSCKATKTHLSLSNDKMSGFSTLCSAQSWC